MGKVLDFILNKKSPESVMYDAAMTAMDRLSRKIKVRSEKGEEEFVIETNVWSMIVPGDPNSPKVMGMPDNNSLIYYPKFSTPYSHKLVDKCKFATILVGCIYDEISGKKFSAERNNDDFPSCVKIRPEDNFRPYTKNCECYILVHIDDCNKLLNDVCV